MWGIVPHDLTRSSGERSSCGSFYLRLNYCSLILLIVRLDRPSQRAFNYINKIKIALGTLGIKGKRGRCSSTPHTPLHTPAFQRSVWYGSRFGGMLIWNYRIQIDKLESARDLNRFRNPTSMGVYHSNGACKDDRERERCGGTQEIETWEPPPSVPEAVPLPLSVMVPA